MCVLHRRKQNFTQLYLTGGEQLYCCAYCRILLKWNLKCCVCGSVDCTGLDQDWVSQFVDQFLDLTKGRVMYLHQLSEFWRTVLYIRCVVPPAYVQLPTLTALRCAPSPPHTRTHTHITFKHSQFSSNWLTACRQLTAQNTNIPNILCIPAARNPEHYFLMMVQVSRQGLHARLLSTECLLTAQKKEFVAPLYMNYTFCGWWRRIFCKRYGR